MKPTNNPNVPLVAEGATIVDRIDLPPRPERKVSPPSPYRQGVLAAWLEKTIGSDMVWSHQAIALDHILAGSNVVVATSTASGKSLIFQAPIIRELLDGQGRAIVFYPQKALGGDQLVRWRRSLAAAGLPENLVGEINGDVSMAERNQILDEARVLLMTHDVFHAWMMRQVASPPVRNFLASLTFGVLDEAHTLEGVFGSNCAFMFRRLRHAVQRFSVDPGKLQFIAATATVAEPAAHLERLTGSDFVLVDEADNGAPSQGLTLLHIEGPAHGAPAERMLAELVGRIAGKITPNAVIAFADKRQGVERITRRVGRDDVMPYRSGYYPADRKKIESAMRAGTLRGIVSTSALELGIDIPQFTIGLNLGVPITRKAARQRVGRVGRTAEGTFAFIAPSHAFTRLGSSFQEFFDGPVEASHLYLENPLVQFQQACCLREECEMVDGKISFPDDINWPEGFAEIFAMSEPGAPKPNDIERIAMLATGNPHLDYPLRHISEPELAIRLARSSAEPIGRINVDKAMKEAFPGANYMHLRRAYRVRSWRTTSYDNSIIVEPVSASDQPKPLIQRTVNVSHQQNELIEGRLLSGPSGSIAETTMRVAESVFGYTSSGKTHLYSELSKTIPAMRSKYREYGSTGVVIRVDEPWFRGQGEGPMAARRRLAQALAEILVRDRSISPTDVSWAHTGISIYGPAGPQKLDDAIAIFDNVQGGLRLTQHVYSEIGAFIDRLGRAAAIAGGDAPLPAKMVEQLRDWRNTLTDAAKGNAEIRADCGPGERVIFAEGSVVCVRFGGQLQQRALRTPRLMDVGDASQLMYAYDAGENLTAWVPHEMVEPVGNDWRRVIWHSETGATREIAA